MMRLHSSTAGVPGRCACSVMAALLTCQVSSPWAAAIPTSANFIARAEIVRGCAVSSNPAQTAGIDFGTLDFGTHSAVQAGTFSTVLGGGSGSGATATVACTPGTTVQISADAGLHAQGAQRRLAGSAGGFVNYALWLTTPSVSLAPGASVPLTLGASAVSLPVGGTATLLGVNLPAGTYTDTVQVTLTW